MSFTFLAACVSFFLYFPLVLGQLLVALSCHDTDLTLVLPDFKGLGVYQGLALSFMSLVHTLENL